MAQIIITPEDVTQKGNDCDKKAQELEALLQATQALVNQLQGGAWKGNRANKFYGDWSAMKPQITKAIETFRNAGILLKKAGQDFGGVDNS